MATASFRCRSAVSFIASACFLFILFANVSVSRAEDPSLDLGEYRGQVVYLDFWASWCVPCRASIPWMLDMQKKYGNDGLKIITVNLDADRQAADEFIRTYGAAPLQTVFDPQGVLAQKYNIQGMPSSFIIGKDGKIRHTHIGFLEAEKPKYEREIKDLLNE